ncbi:MAG: undecaprenyl-diphosphatase UppP [Bacteroidia bacterium]|nr:undecaprenyl-diphosphatase UppP [Bacteroidia bacterium]
MGLIDAIILAIIEGLTEFIPVSSTGHLIITSAVLGLKSDSFVKLFTVGIQFGSILAVVVLYFRFFLKSISFYYKLFVAFIPAAIFGVLLKKQIDLMLESVLVVSIALILGGIVLILIDKIFKKEESKQVEVKNYKTAFIIGIFQIISMIPGVSRSAATIIGGMFQGLTKKAAAEFSFFLAVPTMFGATAKSVFDFFKDGYKLNSEQIKLFAVGNIVAFVVSLIAIQLMISLLTRFGFKYFGYYRIALGAILIGLYIAGVDLKLID